MMQKLLVFVSLTLAFAMAVGIGRVVTADEKPKASASKQTENRATPTKSANTAESVDDSRSAVKMRSPDDATVLAVSKAIVQAYQQHDAKAFAALFTPEGEYVDEKEILFHGRDALEKEFASFFQANPESTIGLKFDVIRTIAPGVIKVQGATSFRRAAADPPANGRCSLVCVQDGSRWLIASLREMETGEMASHHEQLRQLEWMVGEWLSEGPRSTIHISCRWDHDGNFLIRDFSIRTAGSKTLTGTQRIGFDPISGNLKTWLFDSAGGYSDGFFHREGDNWVLHTSGVTADSQIASGTEIFMPLDQNRIVWNSVDRIVGANRLADSGEITIVRKPPQPAQESSPDAKQPSK